MKNKWLILLVLLLPLLSGCNDTDDVQKIFTGKTWKLNYITTKDGHEMYNFWGNDAAAATARKESMKLLSGSGTYLVTFTGATTDDIIKGSISGNVVASKIDGTWSANAKSQSFKATVTAGKETDILAKKFIEILNQADSYTGDENNLYLNFENLSMVFFVVREQQ